MNEQQIVLRMQEGTPRSDQHLCATCSHAVIRRGVSASADIQVCAALSHMTADRRGIITGKIAACSQYYPKTLPPLHMLQEIAWEIVSNGARGERAIGFISPEDRRKAGIGFGSAPPPAQQPW